MNGWLRTGPWLNGRGACARNRLRPGVRRTPDEPFAPKAIADPAKRAWAAVNEREREEAEREGRNPDFLPSLTFHECRHTFASLLIDAGVNPKAIQEFMGHATIEETFSRYGHLMPGAREQARELVDAHMDRLGPQARSTKVLRTTRSVKKPLIPEVPRGQKSPRGMRMKSATGLAKPANTAARHSAVAGTPRAKSAPIGGERLRSAHRWTN
jgi:hypothetical protein